MNRHLLLGVALAVTIPASVEAQLAWTRGAGTGPAIVEAGHAFDLQRDALIVFGGTRGSGSIAETWRHDGSAWVRSFPMTSPTARSRPAMAFDAARGEVVLFGGFDNSGTFLSDTWVWDGANWTQRTPATVPGPRSGAALCFDAVRGVVVMFGGFVAGGTDDDQTWEWNSVDWQLRAPATRPPACGAHRLAFDATRDEVVMHGGYRTPLGATVGDTWTYDGTTWRQRAAAGGPGSLCDEILAFDAARQRVVCFGGANVAGTTVTPLGGAFDWDGNGWVARSFTTATPGTRTLAFGDYDPRRGRVVVAGGGRGPTILTDVWTLAPVQAAAFRSISAGCSGAGVPQIDVPVGELPWLADTFELRITGVPASSSSAAMIVGLSSTQWNGQPLPFDLGPIGATGCWLGTDILLSITVPLQNGSGTFASAVCNCPVALGRSFFLQAVAVDPAAPRALPIVMTPAIEGIVGAR